MITPSEDASRLRAADIPYWGRITNSTLDEAIALSLGQDPRRVDWTKVEEKTSDFAREFAERKEFVSRAHGFGEFGNPIWPLPFVDWARHFEVPFPKELADEVVKWGPEHLSFQTRYERLKPLYDEALKTIERLQAQATEPRQEKGLAVKERQTVLKLIIGMAIGGYAFDPTAARTTAASEVASDLHKLGISIDEDTVRKWLKEAAELLPGDSIQPGT